MTFDRVLVLIVGLSLLASFSRTPEMFCFLVRLSLLYIYILARLAGCAISSLSGSRPPVARRAVYWLFRAAHHIHHSLRRPIHYVSIMVGRMEVVFVDGLRWNGILSPAPLFRVARYVLELLLSRDSNTG